ARYFLSLGERIKVRGNGAKDLLVYPARYNSPERFALSFEHPSAASEIAQRKGQNAQGCRSEEHTSELQSRGHLVCRLVLEKKNLSLRDLYFRSLERIHTPD